jgi:hypothetical protein
MNDVWVTFKRGGTVPLDTHLSEASALRDKFASDEVHHYIHVGDVNDRTSNREEQLERANALLRHQVEDLTRLLEKAERRMVILEKLLGVPVLMRASKRRAA